MLRGFLQEAQRDLVARSLELLAIDRPVAHDLGEQTRLEAADDVADQAGCRWRDEQHVGPLHILPRRRAGWVLLAVVVAPDGREHALLSLRDVPLGDELREASLGELRVHDADVRDLLEPLDQGGHETVGRGVLLLHQLRRAEAQQHPRLAPVGRRRRLAAVARLRAHGAGARGRLAAALRPERLELLALLRELAVHLRELRLVFGEDLVEARRLLQTLGLELPPLLGRAEAALRRHDGRSGPAQTLAILRGT